MPGGKRYPAGPLAYVALGLLVMTWASIRLWRPAPSLRSPGPSAPTARLGATATVPAISIATSARPAVDAAPRSSAAALALEELATMPMVAEIAPPVATRIAFDPVVTLEPEVHLTLEPALVGPLARALPVLAEPELHVARATTERAPDVNRAWAYPVALAGALRRLQTSPAAGDWATEVLAGIDRLFAADALASLEADAALETLEGLSEEAKKVAAGVTAAGDRVTMSRASYGLMRRLLVWRQVERMASSQPVSAGLSAEQMAEQIDVVQHHFASAPTWKRFLLLDDLREATPQTRGALARQVLLRMEAGTLSDAQQAILARPPVTEFSAALKGWAAEPVDLAALLEALEKLEVGDNSQAARNVAAAWHQLRWSSDPRSQELAEHVNTYYRNANARIAISGELLNMLMPEQHATQEDVDDEILGARVFGRSQTSARLRVVLLPDMRRLKLGVEAIGEVDSDTAATKGPATLYSQGVSRFHARKMLSIDRRGLRVWRSQAEVDTENQLTDVETDFDAIPFIGMWARSIARQEHDDKYYEANRQIRGKVASKAESRFDREVHRQLAEAEQEFLHKIYQPLERLQLDPTAVDLSTTRDQLIGRYRIAGAQQMAAYTPRPAVPGNSVLNVQLHQSALNNVLEQLKLDGRRTELETLYRDISQTFNRPIDAQLLEGMPEDVTVQFAAHDAVRVYCDAGRLVLVLKLAELSQARERKWKNFTVQAYYVPSHTTLDASLVREGTIELIGERLNFRDQIALRGIFTKVLSKDRTFNLIQEKFARDPRLASLRIDQFTIDDGWIGLSVGRPRVDKPRVAGENRARK